MLRMGLVLKLSSVICHCLVLVVQITCPYCAITCPYRAIRMGYYRCKKACVFFAKKVAEIFGSFANFLYLCNVVQERITTGGKGHPM